MRYAQRSQVWNATQFSSRRTKSDEDNYDWARFQEILDRSKLQPGQPEMSPEEEEEWIAQQVMAMRAEERA